MKDSHKSEEELRVLAEEKEYKDKLKAERSEYDRKQEKLKEADRKLLELNTAAEQAAKEEPTRKAIEEITALRLAEETRRNKIIKDAVDSKLEIVKAKKALADAIHKKRGK